MRIALSYDYLNQYGGGERVLEVFCNIFPDAPIYTILYDEEKTGGRFAGRKIYTSFLDFKLTAGNHRFFIPLMPLAAQSLNLENKYDLVISATAGYGKGIRYSASTKHLCYCYTPLRYAWEPSLANFQLPIFNYQLTNFLIKKPLLNYLRSWDFRAAQKPDIILADSQFIADKIKNYYKRTAEVLYPPLDEKKFFFSPISKKKNYFLAAGRLAHYKKFNLIIEAFNQLKWPLKIVGNGPEYGNLKRLIRSPNIEMLNFVPDEKLRQMYADARAFIFPQIEDFGLVVIEAQACGTPVIALAKGGALETVEEGKTGLFFQHQTVDGLKDALMRFAQIEAKFDELYIANRAKRFSLQNFSNRIQSLVLCMLEKK
ncbi:MAG: glycosyltransferase [Patescibacteria group bacterium]